MSKADYSQIYQTISLILLTLSKGQQVQQFIREAMTTHPLFNPLSLFKYISKNTSVIKKEHLLQFLSQNKENATENQVKSILTQQSGKKSWQYSNFLQVIFPFNSAVLRQIANLHLKKYKELQKYGVNESSVTSFLMLLTEKISLNRKLQNLKEVHFTDLSKQSLKKVLLSIKKINIKQLSHRQIDNSTITSLQIRNFLKTYVSVQESHFLFLGRRLKIKNGSFPIENLQKLLKPKKNKYKNIKPIEYNQQNTQSENENFNEKSYKKQLYQQLVQNMHLKQSKRQNKQQNTFTQKHGSFSPKKQINQNKHSLIEAQNFIKHQYISYQQNEEQLGKSPKELFIQFIEAFLPAARQIQKLKIKVVQQKIDFLALFKKIDRSHRGVATADDLYHYYIHSGGNNSFSPQKFGLIISKYGQSQDPWLSFAQFCEMIRAEDKQAFSEAKFKERQQLIIIKILELCIKSQANILKICSQFKRNQVKYLFNQINRQNTGYINYQELKKFIIQQGIQLSMHDLMIVLKRLDKSRNGVIIQQEFIEHFSHKLTY